MSFWTRFKEALYSPELYARVVGEPLSSAFKYAACMLAILSLVVAAIACSKIIPPIQEFSHATLNQILSQIPADFSLRIQKNEARMVSSTEEPFFFNLFPESAPEETVRAVIDTRSDFSYEQFFSYEVGVWVARNGVGFVEDQGKISFQFFDGVEDLTITKPLLTETLESIRSALWIGYVLLVPVIFVLTFFVGCVSFAYLLLLALVAWIIAKARGVVLTYAQAYAITLYAATAGFIYEIAVLFFLPVSIPWGFTVVVLLVAAFALDPKVFKATA